MHEDDMRELDRAAARLGIRDAGSLHILLAAMADDGDMDPKLRRMLLRGVVSKYIEAGNLGQYLEHVPDVDTVWSRFHAMISKTAMEMAKERRNGV